MSELNLVVINDPRDFSLELENVRVLTPLEYLHGEHPQRERSARVFNLCSSYSYQTLGYYVSLMAEARGHRAIPSMTTMRDVDSALVVRSMGEDIDEVIQQAFKKETEDRVAFHIYWGQAENARMQRLGREVYNLFPAPVLRVEWVRGERWLLSSVKALALCELDAGSQQVFKELGERFFQQRKGLPKAVRQRFLYDLAILVNPDEPHPPSNPKGLARFTDAARDVGFYTEVITTNDARRICEFDALFIRETTAVDHPTYHLSRLAHAEGLVVIDDPWSILRCANKIYLNEILSRARIPVPRTWILTRDNLDDDLSALLPSPCILKLPDAAFSTGVIKAEDPHQLRDHLSSMLETSDVILAQEFLPSDFDWRIGVLDHRPLFACKYFMARGHWQIYNWQANQPSRVAGNSETLHTEFVPETVIETALKATRLIGDGLYGVDLKVSGNRVVVIEVNDNPNLDAGVEDKALGAELYARIARSLRRRIEVARS
jgi:glutathione synthase/RimK-type ligase-like ATP-grasp enzyme